MKSNSAPKSAANGGTASTSERAPRIGHLTKVSDISRELRRIYRASRCGQLDTTDLSRFTNCLQVMVNVLRDSDLEKRIQQLEAANNAHQQP